jgi:hypothetical protein
MTARALSSFFINQEKKKKRYLFDLENLLVETTHHLVCRVWHLLDFHQGNQGIDLTRSQKMPRSTFDD